MSVEDAWTLTRSLSPRDRVRIATRSADGVVLNSYDRTRALRDVPPAAPWAMHLADDTGYFRWVVFDLDSSHGDPVRDAAELCGWLREFQVEHLVCRSGPTDGRHVWVKADRLQPQLVAAIAHRAQSLLPSLDVSPLTNPATGAVRPPFSPHRISGHSEPLADVDMLRMTALNDDDATAMLDFLDSLGAEQTIPETAGLRGMVLDGDEQPYLQGTRRAPSPRISRLLDAGDAEESDLSRLQATVLAGLARAHWRFADVEAHLAHSPALEHARSIPSGTRGRVPRAGHRPRKVLANAWRLAVRFVAANPVEAEGEDVDFPSRANAVCAAVSAAQERADAQPGRWGHGELGGGTRAYRGRPSQRAVLDALCVYMLQAVRLDVEVDTRRLSADTGYGREACRQALQALTDEQGWLVKVAEAEGPRGGRYRLADRFSTAAEEREWAQVVTRPALPRSPRSTLLRTLTLRLETLAHDVFAAPHSLGRLAGRVLQAFPAEGTVTTPMLGSELRLPLRTLRRSLGLLHAHGLVGRDQTSWRLLTADRDALAEELDVAGYLEARRERYEAERRRWAWWSAEMKWLRARGRKPRRAPTTSVALHGIEPADFSRYPRRPNGSPDHSTALLLVQPQRQRQPVAA